MSNFGEFIYCDTIFAEIIMKKRIKLSKNLFECSLKQRESELIKKSADRRLSEASELEERFHHKFSSSKRAIYANCLAGVNWLEDAPALVNHYRLRSALDQLIEWK